MFLLLRNQCRHPMMIQAQLVIIKNLCMNGGRDEHLESRANYDQPESASNNLLEMWLKNFLESLVCAANALLLVLRCLVR